MGSDLRTEDFLFSGVPIDAQLSSELLLNLFAADTPLHDGAVLVKGNRIISAGVILPLSRQGISRYGTRHLAALGITERFDRCICVVVSEESGTLSLANQGRLERPITSSRLLDLLKELTEQHNRTIVMVLHDINLAVRYADNLIAMRDGKIETSGEPHNVVTAQMIHDVFSIHAQILEDPVSGSPLCIPVIKNT